MDYSNCTTDKFTCWKCHKSKMYPNVSDKKVMGFVCAYCEIVNYPHKDKLIEKKFKVNGIRITY